MLDLKGDEKSINDGPVCSLNRVSQLLILCLCACDPFLHPVDALSVVLSVPLDVVAPKRESQNLVLQLQQLLSTLLLSRLLNLFDTLLQLLCIVLILGLPVGPTTEPHDQPPSSSTPPKAHTSKPTGEEEGGKEEEDKRVALPKVDQDETFVLCALRACEGQEGTRLVGAERVLAIVL